MNLKSWNYQNLLSTVLVLCALVVTASVTWQAIHLNALSEEKPEVRHISNWQTLINGRIPVIGNTEARIKIIKFSDYQCPYCRQLEPVLDRLAVKHRDEIAIYHYDFPLTKIHPRAYMAAIAAKCAALQEAQYAYQNLLYNSNIEQADWVSIAKQAGLRDLEAFQACITNRLTDSADKHDIQMGKTFSINGTPTLIINGFFIKGMLLARALETIIMK